MDGSDAKPPALGAPVRNARMGRFDPFVLSVRFAGSLTFRRVHPQLDAFAAQ